VSKGSRDAGTRAGEIWRAALAGHERPALAPEVEERLAAFVARRRAELGD
jgi:trimethylamine:corrinoid methyltransferase-like protein